MPLRVLGGPLPTRKVRKLGAWTRPGNAWNGGESVGLIGGLIGGGAPRGGGGPAGPSSTRPGTFSLFYTRRARGKIFTAPPLFLPRVHPTEWWWENHPETAPTNRLRP